jgi:hypothetical protein
LGGYKFLSTGDAKEVHSLACLLKIVASTKTTSQSSA